MTTIIVILFVLYLVFLPYVIEDTFKYVEEDAPVWQKICTAFLCIFYPVPLMLEFVASFFVIIYNLYEMIKRK